MYGGKKYGTHAADYYTQSAKSAPQHIAARELKSDSYRNYSRNVKAPSIDHFQPNIPPLPSAWNVYTDEHYKYLAAAFQRYNSGEKGRADTSPNDYHGNSCHKGRRRGRANSEKNTYARRFDRFPSCDARYQPPSSQETTPRQPYAMAYMHPQTPSPVSYSYPPCDDNRFVNLPLFIDASKVRVGPPPPPPPPPRAPETTFQPFHDFGSLSLPLRRSRNGQWVPVTDSGCGQWQEYEPWDAALRLRHSNGDYPCAQSENSSPVLPAAFAERNPKDQFRCLDNFQRGEQCNHPMQFAKKQMDSKSHHSNHSDQYASNAMEQVMRESKCASHNMQQIVQYTIYHTDQFVRNPMNLSGVGSLGIVMITPTAPVNKEPNARQTMEQVSSPVNSQLAARNVSGLSERELEKKYAWPPCDIGDLELPLIEQGSRQTSDSLSTYWNVHDGFDDSPFSAYSQIGDPEDVLETISRKASQTFGMID